LRIANSETLPQIRNSAEIRNINGVNYRGLKTAPLHVIFRLRVRHIDAIDNATTAASIAMS
jgi:hypothetical protein